MEQELREAKERFSNVLEYSQDASYRRNVVTDKYDYMSPVIERLTGYTLEEMTVMTEDTVLKKIHPDDLHNAVKRMSEASTRNYASDAIEYRFLCKNGEYRWFLDRFTSVKGGKLNLLQDILSKDLIANDIPIQLPQEDLLGAQRMALQI